MYFASHEVNYFSIRRDKWREDRRGKYGEEDSCVVVILQPSICIVFAFLLNMRHKFDWSYLHRWFLCYSTWLQSSVRTFHHQLLRGARLKLQSELEYAVKFTVYIGKNNGHNYSQYFVTQEQIVF